MVNGNQQQVQFCIQKAQSTKGQLELSQHICMIMIYRIVSEKDLYLVILLKQKETMIKPKLPGVTTSPRQNTLQMSL